MPADASDFGSQPLDLLIKPRGIAATVVTNVGGVRFGARVRKHTVFTDQGAKGGGTDSAPSPVDLLGVALGSCVAFYVRQFLLTRLFSVAGMRVEVAQRNGVEPARVAKFNVLIVLPNDLLARHRLVLDRIVKTCPVYNTLKCGATINVEVITPSANSMDDFAEMADCVGR